MKMSGNTVFITGGGSGIGRGLAEAFHKLDNQVIVAGRRRGNLDEAVAANPGMAAVELDITDPASIANAATQLTRTYPKLNALLNNAGIMLPDKAAGQIDDKLLVDTVTTNLMGPIRMSSALIGHLRQENNAVIVYTSSILAFVPIAFTAVYSATKAALHSYALSQRFLLNDAGVGVLEMAPPIARLHRGKWMGGVAYGLRRLSKGAQEASAHPLAVTKAGFLGDFLDRQPSLLEHISGRLKTKILDGAGRRLTGFCPKHPGKLPRAEPRRLRELLHRQRLSKVVPGKGERVLNAVGFRVDLKQRRVLRLSAGPSMMNHHHLGGRAGGVPAHVPFDKTKRHVNAGGHPCGGPDRTVCYENAVNFDPDLRKTPLKFLSPNPVCGCAPPVENPCFGKCKRATADRGDTPHVCYGLAQKR
jgi:uncharacterized oxidoreductase